MSAAVDLTNQTFGRLTAIEIVGRNKHGRPLWKCVCECGAETTVSSNHLRDKTTKSCGCHRNEIFGIGGGNSKHGCARKGCETPEYGAWRNAKKRCTNS